MRRIIIIGLLVLTGIASVYFVHYTLLQNEVKNLSIRPFIADLVEINSDGRKRNLEKIYSGGKGIKLVSAGYSEIFRGDKRVIWLITSRNTYIEYSFKNIKKAPQRSWSPFKFPRKGYIGTTLIDGQLAYNFIGRKGLCIQDQFISTKDLVPLEIDINCGIFPKFIMKFENIELGEPPASVFDEPVGYQKTVINNIEGLEKYFHKN